MEMYMPSVLVTELQLILGNLCLWDDVRVSSTDGAHLQPCRLLSA
jgi:hypothetical protein